MQSYDINSLNSIHSICLDRNSALKNNNNVILFFTSRSHKSKIKVRDYSEKVGQDDNNRKYIDKKNINIRV